MNKYSKDMKCIKCRCEEISDKFLPKGKFFHMPDGNSQRWMSAPEEMIERMCSNCGFIFL